MATAQLNSPATGVLTMTLGSVQITLDISSGCIRLKDGELGGEVFDISQNDTEAIDTFARWWTEDEHDTEIEPPNRPEVIVNTGTGERKDVLDGSLVLDSELWAFMAHNLLRFATNKMGQVVNTQADQSPALPQRMQPGVVPFPSGPR